MASPAGVHATTPFPSGHKRGARLDYMCKTRFCIFHAKGLCKYGVLCSFAHSTHDIQPLPEGIRKTKLCVDFRNGRCKEADCRFAHSESELNMRFYKTTLCNRNKKGMCSDGEKCSFAHALMEVRGRRGPAAAGRGAAGPPARAKVTAGPMPPAPGEGPRAPDGGAKRGLVLPYLLKLEAAVHPDRGRDEASSPASALSTRESSSQSIHGDSSACSQRDYEKPQASFPSSALSDFKSSSQSMNGENPPGNQRGYDNPQASFPSSALSDFKSSSQSMNGENPPGNQRGYDNPQAPQACALVDFAVVNNAPLNLHVVGGRVLLSITI